jgi:hypothetical protein
VERQPKFSTVWQLSRFGYWLPDLEAATRDPRSGDYWLAFENSNAVARLDVVSTMLAARQPEAMTDWPSNGGAEAMARLPDGRFLLLPERGDEGLLFAGDPSAAGPVTSFPLALPGGYAATDMMGLPDGRLLVLLRKLDWAIPPYSAKLGIADPAGIASGAPLEVEPLANLDAILPRENYEGLAVEPRPDGSLTIWIISDDNMAAMQRTLLARLNWRP